MLSTVFRCMTGTSRRWMTLGAPARRDAAIGPAKHERCHPTSKEHTLPSAALRTSLHVAIRAVLPVSDY